MIEINDLSSDESSDVILSEVLHSSSTADDSLPQNSNDDIKYDTSNIKF
jgi:hypothetical protein